MLQRLKKRRDFLRIAGQRRYCAVGGLVLQAAPMPPASMPEAENDRPPLRVGFTVSRRVGGAVIRNRAKRRLRSIAELVLPAHAAADHDYVLIGRQGTPKRPFDRLQRDLETALKRLHLYVDVGETRLPGEFEQ